VVAVAASRESEKAKDVRTEKEEELDNGGSNGGGSGDSDGNGDGGGAAQTEEKRATTLLRVSRELRHIYQKLRHCHRRHCRFVDILRIPSKSINRSPVPGSPFRSTACLLKCVMLGHVSARQRNDGKVL